MLKLFSNLKTIQNRQIFSSSAIKTVVGHKAPISEDTVQGRYASVVFASASKEQQLDKVNEDMINLKQIVQKSEKFREFLSNVSLKRSQQSEVMNLMVGNLNDNTNLLIKALIDNKRLDDLPRIVDKFIENYKVLNKEENIRIISASELSKEDQKRVMASLKQAQKGVNFTIKYEVDPAILGGLQMYSGNTFMDCSLFSRVQKVKSELAKLAF